MLNELFVIFVLTLINGVFSMSETAIISSRRTRLEMKAKKGNAGAKQAIANIILSLIISTHLLDLSELKYSIHFLLIDSAFSNNIILLM